MIFASYNPQNYTKNAGAFLSSQETIFCRNLKNARISFLGRCNVETASCPGLSCSKVAEFEGGLSIKFSRATFLVFMSTQIVDMKQI